MKNGLNIPHDRIFTYVIDPCGLIYFFDAIKKNVLPCLSLMNGDVTAFTELLFFHQPLSHINVHTQSKLSLDAPGIDLAVVIVGYASE